MGNEYRSIVDDRGRTTMVDSFGVRYFTEDAPGYWTISVSAGNWEGWIGIAEAILATPRPDEAKGKTT